MWTLVGGGIKTLDQSRRPMSDVMPKRATWIKQAVTEFAPDNNHVILKNGSKIGYEYLIVALGLRVNFDKVRLYFDILQGNNWIYLMMHGVTMVTQWNVNMVRSKVHSSR